MANFGTDPWTDERIERLKTLWTDGYSAQAISERLGCSRNAVIGKSRRLNLPRHKNAAGQSRTYTERSKAAYKGLGIKSAGNSQPRGRLSSLLPPRAPTTADRDIPMPQRRSLMELTSHTCRWPVGEPHDKAAFFFCGGLPVEGLPYCAAHCERAYERVREDIERLAGIVA